MDNGVYITGDHMCLITKLTLTITHHLTISLSSNKYILFISLMWLGKKENQLTLQQAEMRIIGWMCGVKVTDRFICTELRERLGIDGIIRVVQ